MPRKADVVVVNADTPWAYKNLLHNVQACGPPLKGSLKGFMGFRV